MGRGGESPGILAAGAGAAAAGPSDLPLELTCLKFAPGSSGVLSAASATSFLMPGNLESHWRPRNKTEIEDFC